MGSILPGFYNTRMVCNGIWCDATLRSLSFSEWKNYTNFHASNSTEQNQATIVVLLGTLDPINEPLISLHWILLPQNLV